MYAPTKTCHLRRDPKQGMVLSVAEREIYIDKNNIERRRKTYLFTCVVDALNGSPMSAQKPSPAATESPIIMTPAIPRKLCELMLFFHLISEMQAYANIKM